jgi:uncharacterized phage protein (TIGR01671 family)
MREILFRGKRADNGEWVEGVLLPIDLTDTHSSITCIGKVEAHEGNRNISICNFDNVISETVGQYTGVKDKNGVKIFEGDIVKEFIPFNFTICGKKTYEEPVYVIEYCDGKCGFSPFCEEDYDGMPIIEECVIIGNIHDNPELLEVKPNV